MKQVRTNKKRRKLNNNGFSLVELLVSIAVLVIIMVPLMSNFLKSIFMNKKAEELQLLSNLSASIMEGIKSNKINEIIDEFNGQEDDFDLIPNDIITKMRLMEDGSGGYIITNSSDEQAPYYFAINGIDVGGTAYDAFIKLDAASYKEVVLPGETGNMNSYPMPEVINLDEKANGLLFSNGATETEIKDQEVLDTFLIWGTAYAQNQLMQSDQYRQYLQEYADCESKVLEGITVPAGDWPTEPTLSDLPTEMEVYYNPDELVKVITKTMTVSLNSSVLQYTITYDCGWPAGSGLDSRITYQIPETTYANAIDHVYLFYTPSIFRAARTGMISADKIVFQNISGNPVSFFIALQGGTHYVNQLELQSTGGNVSLFTDVDVTERKTLEPINEKIVKTKEEDRIFEVTINICRFGGEADVNHRYQTVLYTLSSTKEK